MFEWLKRKNKKSEPEVVENVVTTQEAIIRKNLNIKMESMSNLERSMKRMYDAAKEGGVLATWTGAYGTANDDIRGALIKVRARARDLEQNNPFMKKYLQLLKVNIIGPNGFKLQVNIKEDNGNPDRLANNLVEESFYDWSFAENCDVSGKLSFLELQNMALNTVARDGDAVLIHIEDKAINKYGYSTQLVDSDRLATWMNGKSVTGNQVVMGVELNKYNKPVAYYFGKGKTQYGSNFEDVDRVDADNVLHLYRADRAEQARGIPWAHSVMVSMDMLSTYLESDLTRQKVLSAMHGGWYEAPDHDTSPFADDEVDGELYQYADPGRLMILPPGYKFNQFSASGTSPHNLDFTKTTLRHIAAGLGVSYHSLSTDLENVNYSSIRSGVLEEREIYMTQQAWFANHFLRPIYLRWLKNALQNGAIAYPTGTPLPASKFDKFKAHDWRGRRWTWVDPKDEVKAYIDAINAGLKSRKEVISEYGLDRDEVWLELSQEQQDIKKYDLYIEKVSEVLNAKEAVAVQKNNDATQAQASKNFETLQRSLDDLKTASVQHSSVQMPQPNITVEAPKVEVHPVIQPMIRMPGTKTVKKIIRDDRGLPTHVEEVDELEEETKE